MKQFKLTDIEACVLKNIDENEITALLQALIRQRSDHPPGDCRGAVKVVIDKLSEAGIEYEIHSRQEHQPNLIAHYPAGCQQKRLTFHAHIDTVSPGDLRNWQVDPFGGEVLNGAVYGRGAGDDKGSVAVQVMAMTTLARAGVQIPGCLQLAVVSDEESDALNGTHWLREEGILRTEALVVGEQTNNTIAVAERVACGIDLTIFGKGTHGAMPWAGDNAVMKTARVLAWLEKNYFPRLAEKPHPFLPPATLNIGRISGGIGWNFVPDSCKVEMDRRLLPGETREAAMQELRDALDAYAASVEPVRYDLFSSGLVAANINTPPDHPFVLAAQGVLTAVCGELRELSGYMQTSDGRWFARDGIPIIIFGPSDPSVGHTADEHVTIEQLVEATRFLTLLAMRWG